MDGKFTPCMYKLLVLVNYSSALFGFIKLLYVHIIIGFIKLTRALYIEHISCALQCRCLSIYGRLVRNASSLLTTFTYIILLYQVVRMSREHIVGSVHRRGQQNAVFATLVGLAKQFEAY